MAGGVMLDNHQHELFCQKIAEGMNQTDAYEAAGYKGSRKSLNDNAARLIGNDRIQARIAELRSEAAQEAQIDLAWLIKEAVATYQAAKKDSAYGPAVSALKEVGILTGVRIEKSDNTNRTVSDESGLTRAELYAIALAGRDRAAAPGSGSGKPN